MPIKPDELTPMERAYIELNARWYIPGLEFPHIRVLDREHTGIGRYTQFSGPAVVPPPRDPLGIGHIEMEGFEGGLTALIWTDDARFAELELVTNGAEEWDGTERPWTVAISSPRSWDGRHRQFPENSETITSVEGGTPLENAILELMTGLFLPGFQLDQLTVTNRAHTGTGRRTTFSDLGEQRIQGDSLCWGRIEMKNPDAELGVRVEITAHQLTALELFSTQGAPWDGVERPWSFVTTWPMPPPLMGPATQK